MTADHPIRPAGDTPATQPRAPLKGRHGVVPYIALWSGETAHTVPVIATPHGIAYPDEMITDRDSQGVLWNRTPSRQGAGEPLYNKIHPLRQRRAMRHLRCQICAAPADHNHLGTLWLLPDHHQDWDGWPERIADTHPPLCLRCAHISVKACPHLRPGFAAVRAHSTIVGVNGTLYRPGHPLPPASANTTVAHTSPAIRWVRAGQLVRELHHCTPADL